MNVAIVRKDPPTNYTSNKRSPDTFRGFSTSVPIESPISLRERIRLLSG